jgi:hypothetical protein
MFKRDSDAKAATKLVRLTQYEREALRRLARLHDTTNESAVIRALIERAAKEFGCWYPSVEHSEP